MCNQYTACTILYDCSMHLLVEYQQIKIIYFFGENLLKFAKTFQVQLSGYGNYFLTIFFLTVLHF